MTSQTWISMIFFKQTVILDVPIYVIGTGYDMNGCTEVQNRWCMRCRMRMCLLVGKWPTCIASCTMLEGFWLCNGAVSENPT